MIPSLIIEFVEFHGNVYFFCSRPEVLFLGELVQTNPICLLKMKIGTKSNFSMLSSIMIFKSKEPILGKFGPKNENCLFMIKFGT